MSAGPVEEAVRADLEALVIPVGASSLAQSAIALAKKLDDDAGLATAAVARELRATMTALLPSEQDGKPDELSELVARLSAPVQHSP